MKADLVDFKAATKKLELAGLRHDIVLAKGQNHCAGIDNFVERFLPLIVQRQIDDTLRSTFSGKERRRLELYDVEKHSLLYHLLLCDDGQGGNLQEAMRTLHSVAVGELEAEDRRKKKQMAITEASHSGDEVHQNTSVGTIEKGVAVPNSGYGLPSPPQEIEDSPMRPGEASEHARQSPMAGGIMSAGGQGRESTAMPRATPQLLGTQTPQHAS